MVSISKPARPELKGRPPLRKCPDDFDVIYVEQGRLGCEAWYRAHKRTVTRWLIERGKARLIKARAAFVKHQRSQGKWLTRSTCMVQHRVTGLAALTQPVRDRRMVSGTLARHAAQHLRIARFGGFIVSPSSNGDWRVGTRSLSAAQMVGLACSKGFDQAAAMNGEELDPDPRQRLGDFHTRSSRLAEKDKADTAALRRQGVRR